MSREIATKLSPEERELEKKRGELAALEVQLVQLELDLATLQAELRTFEGRYLRSVGRFYAELDEIEAQIAEALARFSPKDHAAQQQAAHARRQAHESAQAAGEAGTSEPAPTVFHPSESIKKLYRDVARRVHPDLASNDQDRLRRHEVMAAVNRAYAEGDETQLRQILEAWERSPESVAGTGVAAALVRVIRQIAQVQERLQAIETEIRLLRASELYQLKTQADEAESAGRDLLRAMAARVQEQIVQARARLREILQRGVHI